MTKKSSAVRKATSRGGKKKSEDQQPAVSDQIIARVRELAWAGQHAQAIELATQKLNMSGLKPDLQMDLLDLRAESYLAQFNIDAAEKDAALMLKLAKAGNKPAWKAKALIRKGVVQSSQNKNESATKTLTSALKLSRQSKLKHLEAESLLRLADAQTGEQAIKSTQQAADLFTSLADP